MSVLITNAKKKKVKVLRQKARSKMRCSIQQQHSSALMLPVHTRDVLPAAVNVRWLKSSFKHVRDFLISLIFPCEVTLLPSMAAEVRELWWHLLGGDTVVWLRAQLYFWYRRLFPLRSLPSDVKKVTAIPLPVSYHIHPSFQGYEQHFNTCISFKAFPSLKLLFFPGLVSSQIAHYLQCLPPD